jgi:hypothetical protein
VSLTGAHEAIIDEEVWKDAMKLRSSAHRRTGGRHPDGGHLLGRGLLRCGSCGSAMLPRKARPGGERDRYVCSGRIEHGPAFCSQPSVRREAVDQPFLEHLLDGYVDFEATKARIDQRVGSALMRAREAVSAAEIKVVRIEGTLAETERAYDKKEINARQYHKREDRLTAELKTSREELKQARDQVREIEQTGTMPDGEQVLLDHLARLRKAVSEGVGGAPDLSATRNVIRDLFEAVELIPAGSFGHDTGSEGFISALDNPVVTTKKGEPAYWLLMRLRWSAVDAGTFKPIGHEMPVPWAGQYPPGFLCRYCWW